MRRFLSRTFAATLAGAALAAPLFVSTLARAEDDDVIVVNDDESTDSANSPSATDSSAPPTNPTSPANPTTPAAGPIQPAPMQTAPTQTATDPPAAVVASDDESDQPASASASDSPSDSSSPAQAAAGDNVDTAAFKGIKPGVTTVQQLAADWGAPVGTAPVDGFTQRTYAIEGFKRVDVYADATTVRYIVVELNKQFAPEAVAQQLQFADLKPVMIYDDFGKPLGQAFPERGVAFSFLTGSPQPFVTQILLEPVSAEAFFVRAQNTWKTNPEAALADLHQTFKREPNHDRAHDLQSKIELASGQVDAALVAAEKAVAINAASGEFRLTLAAALAASGDFARATQHVREAGDSSDPSSTLKAQSLLALGDLLVDQPNPNHKEALQAYMEAIRAADAFANEKHVQPRRQAKLVLVDAHLGAARAICAGAWKKKEAVVPKWLAKAEAAAGDMLQNEAAGDEFRFHVARQTLAALAGQPGLIDESRYAQQVASLAARMQNSSTDARFRAQVQWQTSEALYHAVVNAHARNARNEAQSYAQAAVQYMESAGPHRQQSAALAAFAGRLYFRVGAVHAALANDHPAAVAWYKKAIPLLEQPAPATAEANSKMQGEAFVGMGVSMWHVGDKEEAVRLTTEGVHLFEQAAQQGLIASAELEIPYKNLSAMHGQLGNDAESKQFAELAARSTQDGPVRK